MTVFLAFNEAEALNDAGDAVADTDVAVSGVARAGFRTFDAGDGGLSAGPSVTLDATFVTQSEAWIHCKILKNQEGSFARGQAGDVFRVVDDDGNQIVNIYHPGNTTGVIQAYSTLDATKDTIYLGSATVMEFDCDIHVNIASGTSGFIDIYVDQVLQYSKTGDTVASTSATGVNKLEFVDAGRSGAGKDVTKSAWCQVIVSDENTLGSKVFTLDPSAGNVNDWPIGDVTDVDEQGVDDGDQMQTDTYLDEVSFDSSITLSALSEPQKFTALVQSYRASLDASASVTGLTPFLQDDGGTNTYYAAAPSSITSGLAPYQEIWSQDPADSTDWTAAKINGYEYGYRADN